MNCTSISFGLNLRGPIVNGGLLVPHYDLESALRVLDRILLAESVTDSVVTGKHLDRIPIRSGIVDETTLADPVDTIAIETVKKC